MPPNRKPGVPAASGDFESLVVSIVQIHQQAQEYATKAVNVGLTLRNWFIGHRIVEFEQHGRDRAAYGERLLPALAKRLAAAGLRRVDSRELRRFRVFYSLSADSGVSDSRIARHLASPGNSAPPAVRPADKTGDTVSRISNCGVSDSTIDLSDQIFVSRYAVEMPDKAAMEAFLKQLGKEIGHEH